MWFLGCILKIQGNFNNGKKIIERAISDNNFQEELVLGSSFKTK